MNVPLARFLARFPVDGDDFVPPPLPATPDLTMSAADFDAALDAARSTVAAEYEVRIADVTTRLTNERAEALAAARTAWCEAEGAALARHLDNVLAGLEIRLAEQVADVLRPLLDESVAAHARAALLETLDLALADPSRHALVLQGPADLLAAIRAARPNAACVEYRTRDGVEATLAADGLHIETRLAGALAALRPTES